MCFYCVWCPFEVTHFLALITKSSFHATLGVPGWGVGGGWLVTCYHRCLSKLAVRVTIIDKFPSKIILFLLVRLPIWSVITYSSKFVMY